MNTRQGSSRSSRSGEGEVESEKALVQRARRRDLAAFEELVNRHRAQVFALALHSLQDLEDAEDALQGTFLEAWERFPSFRGEVPVSAWLAGLCGREIASRLPAHADGPKPTILRLVAPPPRAAAHDPRSLRLRVAIASTVARMPAPRRVSFVLGELGGASCAEIASALGLDPPAVRRHIHEALLSVLGSIEACGRAG